MRSFIDSSRVTLVGARLVSCSLVLGLVACSGSPAYDSQYKKPSAATSEDAQSNKLSKNSDVPDHGPVPDAVVPPGPIAQIPPAPPAPPATPTQEQAYKAMLAKGKVTSDITIDAASLDATSTANHWFTSADKRLEVLVAVDAAGAPIVPANVTARQIASGTPGSPSTAQFMAGAAPVATMHSSLRVCNKSAQSIYLHSGNGAPFAHGSGPVAANTCAEFLVQRAAVTDGATYDHAQGNNPNNYVFMKVVKIDPNGKVVP